MEQEGNSFGTVLKRPSAFLALAMSVVALAMVLASVLTDIALYGHIVRQTDEGVPSHIWQILMIGQIPLAMTFMPGWLRRAPGQALRVLALQAGAWLAACAPVYFLHL